MKAFCVQIVDKYTQTDDRAGADKCENSKVRLATEYQMEMESIAVAGAVAAAAATVNTNNEKRNLYC